MRKGFTFIEVMIAVVIISVVISALLSIYANSTHMFSRLDEKSATNQYLSFMLDNSAYGLKNKNITLYSLLKDFNVDNGLKEESKSVRIKVIYQKLKSIDLGDLQDQKVSNSQMIFEVGKTVLKVNESSSALIRVNLQ